MLYLTRSEFREIENWRRIVDWIPGADPIRGILSPGRSANGYLRQSQLHRYYDVPSDHWTKAWNKLSRLCSRVENARLAPSQLGCCPSPMPVNEIGFPALPLWKVAHARDSESADLTRPNLSSRKSKLPLKIFRILMNVALLFRKLVDFRGV